MPDAMMALATLFCVDAGARLLREVNAISGITASEEQIARAIEDPLAQAAFRLSQAFGWTPEQIGKLTMGEVLAHLQLLKSA